MTENGPFGAGSQLASLSLPGDSFWMVSVSPRSACAVKHQATLLLRRLGWHEPHGCRGDGLANRLSIGHIVLLPLDVGLYVSRWH
jgi:hypothetical protein